MSCGVKDPSGMVDIAELFDVDVDEAIETVEDVDAAVETALAIALTAVMALLATTLATDALATDVIIAETELKAEALETTLDAATPLVGEATVVQREVAPAV